jgi:prepilin-type processing-associated H-X9-DG protein
LNSSLNNNYFNGSNPGNITGRAYFLAKKANDLNTPGPANVFAFVDDSCMTLLADGRSVFSFNPGLASGGEYFRGLPAFYHGKSGNVSFADGHAELHKWLEGSTYMAIVPNPNPPPPAQKNVATSQDYEWLDDHTVYH